MKNFKFQQPSSREISSANNQTTVQSYARIWNLKFGASLVLGAWCLMLLLCPSVRAQSYSLDWFTVDGGGGTSTGAVYSVSGTIGQPDAGHMSGGNYSLDGGFWGIIAAVQTPGAPLLAIRLTSTNTVAVSWPSPSTGFTLQQNTNGIATVNWSNVLATPSDDGTTKALIVNPPTGNRFYRLVHP